MSSGVAPRVDLCTCMNEKTKTQRIVEPRWVRSSWVTAFKSLDHDEEINDLISQCRYSVVVWHGKKIYFLAPQNLCNV